MRLAVLACLAAPVALVACDALLAVQEGHLRMADAEADDGGQADGTTSGDVALADVAGGGADQGSGDAGDGASADADANVKPPCPGTSGPAPLRVTLAGIDFCIDSTEVTADDYAAFLAAKAGDTSGQPQYCAFNGTYTPTTWPQTPGGAAVFAVDECDALAYCAWAGKRLCGAIGGGTLLYTATDDPTSSQWFFACSHHDDGLHAYPYGNAFDLTACNGDQDAGHVAPVASYPLCIGGFPGLYDMSGNVNEWEDSCDHFEGGMDYCHLRGGSYLQDPVHLECVDGYVGYRANTYADVGFRCCSP
jgi:formylglycine-generating enzyme required for sulfatase activity